MKATEANLLAFLNGLKQFVIPIYQRTYSWDEIQCEQLWNDIVATAKDPTVPGHFMGSIVYIQRGVYQASGVPQLLVIDGQQRLTTVSLLLHALGEALKAGNNEESISQKKINNYYLFNSEEAGDLRYKLILTQSDMTTLKRLLDKRPLPQPSSKRVTENHRYFVERIADCDLDLAQLYEGVARLIIVDISLDRSNDNPQLIFESLNSTGLKLSQADLIRNYVLMSMDPHEQEKLYTEHWYPMEQSFGETDYVKRFDRFMRDYLTVKTKQIPNEGDVYKAFKQYVPNGKAGVIHEAVADIHCFSGYFVRMARELEPVADILEVFKDINTLRVEVAYPFFMEIYHDYVQGRLDRVSLLRILRLVESYVFRRAICGIPTNTLNKTFAALASEIDKTQYLVSFMAVMARKDSYRRFPTDEEFLQAMTTKDIYNFRSRLYCLDKLENYERKEPANVVEFTIEHIMPQNEKLCQEWQRDLGQNWKDVQAQYLHTIGNLTLTGYNPELSDRPFLEKRDLVKGGFADSPLHLNHALAKLVTWNEGEIKKRGEDLAQIAVRAWPYLTISPDVQTLLDAAARQESATRSCSLDDHPQLVGPVRDLFEHLRRRVLNLDPSVREDILSSYIAYKTTTNFVDVSAQRSRLLLILNMKFDEVDDPKHLCRDMTGKGKMGNGDVEVTLRSLDQLDDIMLLVHQSFEKHSDMEDA